MTEHRFIPDAPSSALAADQGPRSPTRRRLLTLLATAPISLPSNVPAVPVGDLPHDPIPRLFTQFEAILSAHERALACIDRLEAALVARIGYPRVRLSISPSTQPLYATDTSTIDRLLPPGGRARCYRRLLQRRHWRWDAAAEGCGLADAHDHEMKVARAVHAIGAALLAQPAVNRDGVRLKLIVLLALHQPGQIDAAASPWRELHLILHDLGNPLVVSSPT